MEGVLGSPAARAAAVGLLVPVVEGDAHTAVLRGMLGGVMLTWDLQRGHGALA